jgi:hypothetical protein
MSVATPEQHECDDYGHCLHSDTAENRLLASIFGKDWQGGWHGPVDGCPLCEAEVSRDRR